MKKLLVILTAFAATFTVVPEAAIAARADVAKAASAESNTTAQNGTEVKQRRDRYRRNGRNWNRGHHARRGNRWGWRTNCRRVWRHGRPQRICQRVRYSRW